MVLYIIVAKHINCAALRLRFFNIPTEFQFFGLSLQGKILPFEKTKVRRNS
jgi:hypothetical protein